MKKYIFLLISLLFICSCGEIDNYDEPNAMISGGVFDAKNKEELIPEQSPNGCRIRLYSTDKVSNTPINFYCNMDGTFQNTRIFAGNYKVIAEGPFVNGSVDTVSVKLSQKDITIYAEPCLRINAEAQLSGTTLNVNYTVTQSPLSKGTCTTYYILYSTFEKIDINNRTAYKTVDVSAAPLGEQHAISLDGIDISGHVYARVAARSSETSYYNYSKVIKVK
jgi:hypothetical protein